MTDEKNMPFDRREQDHQQKMELPKSRKSALDIVALQKAFLLGQSENPKEKLRVQRIQATRLTDQLLNIYKRANASETLEVLHQLLALPPEVLQVPVDDLKIVRRASPAELIEALIAALDASANRREAFKMAAQVGPLAQVKDPIRFNFDFTLPANVARLASLLLIIFLPILGLLPATAKAAEDNSRPQAITAPAPEDTTFNSSNSSWQKNLGGLQATPDDKDEPTSLTSRLRKPATATPAAVALNQLPDIEASTTFSATETVTSSLVETVSTTESVTYLSSVEVREKFGINPEKALKIGWPLFAQFMGENSTFRDPDLDITDELLEKSFKFTSENGDLYFEVDGVKFIWKEGHDFSAPLDVTGEQKQTTKDTLFGDRKIVHDWFVLQPEVSIANQDINLEFGIAATFNPALNRLKGFENLQDYRGIHYDPAVADAAVNPSETMSFAKFYNDNSRGLYEILDNAPANLLRAYSEEPEWNAVFFENEDPSTFASYTAWFEQQSMMAPPGTPVETPERLNLWLSEVHRLLPQVTNLRIFFMHSVPEPEYHMEDAKGRPTRSYPVKNYADFDPKSGKLDLIIVGTTPNSESFNQINRLIGDLTQKTGQLPDGVTIFDDGGVLGLPDNLHRLAYAIGTVTMPDGSQTVAQLPMIVPIGGMVSPTE